MPLRLIEIIVPAASGKAVKDLLDKHEVQEYREVQLAGQKAILIWTVLLTLLAALIAYLE